MKKKIFVLITNNYFSNYLIKNLMNSKPLEIFDLEFIYVYNNLKLRRSVTNFVLLSFFNFFEIAYNIFSNLFRKKFNIKKIKNINDQFFINYINKKKPYLVVSLLCSQIFKKKTIININCDIVNFHPGILPNYRGLYPNFYSILNNEKHIGITFHQINEKIDDGKIFNIKKFDLKKNNKIFHTYKKLFFNIETIKFIEASLLNYNKIKKTTYNTVFLERNNSKYYSLPTLKQILKYKFKI